MVRFGLAAGRFDIYNKHVRIFLHII